MRNKQFIREIKEVKNNIKAEDEATAYVYSQFEGEYFQILDIEVRHDGSIVIVSD